MNERDEVEGNVPTRKHAYAPTLEYTSQSPATDQMLSEKSPADSEKTETLTLFGPATSCFPFRDYDDYNVQSSTTCRALRSAICLYYRRSRYEMSTATVLYYY
jgi:hypothetical protein